MFYDAKKEKKSTEDICSPIIEKYLKSVNTYNFIFDGWVSSSPPITIIPFSLTIPVNLVEEVWMSWPGYLISFKITLKNCICILTERWKVVLHLHHFQHTAKEK